MITFYFLLHNRDESDEIRLMRSKKEALHVASDQLLQIAQKRDRKGKEKEREAIWAQLWQNDMAAKDEEEAKKREKAREGLEEVLKGREEQIQALKARKAEEARLKEEEEALDREYQALRKRREDEEALEKALDKPRQMPEVQHLIKVTEAESTSIATVQEKRP